MDWAALTPAIFSLLGVALGTTGSAVATYYAHRTSREQQRLTMATALREERKAALLDYVRAVQDCWRFLEGAWGRRPLVAQDGSVLDEGLMDQEAAQRMHELWYHQQRLALVAPAAVHESAWRLTERMQRAYYQRETIESRFYDFLHPAHQEFLDTANADLRALPLP